MKKEVEKRWCHGCKETKELTPENWAWADKEHTKFRIKCRKCTNFASKMSHIIHYDGNKLNNNVSNLEWATHKEQKVHAWNNNLIWNKRNNNGTFLKKEVMPNE